jgi:uncharacterized protein YukE
MTEAILTQDSDTLFELSARVGASADRVADAFREVHLEKQAASGHLAGATSEALGEALGRLVSAEHDLVTALRWIAATVRQMALNLSAVDYSVASLFG